MRDVSATVDMPDVRRRDVSTTVDMTDRLKNGGDRLGKGGDGCSDKAATVAWKWR
jgi:hypothetical protein